MRLNGWKRIGIVASVVWMLWAFSHYDGVATERYQRFANSEVQRCLDANGGKELPDVGCVRRGEDYTLAHMGDEEEEVVSNAFLPVPLGWGFVYLVLFVVRWVRRGFADDHTAAPNTETEENSLGTSEGSKA